MYFPYVRPQENGHHTDVRRLWLTPDKGKGLLVEADSIMEFNALHNSIEDFDSEENAARPYQWTNFSAEEIAERDESKAKNIMRRQTHINDIYPQYFVEVCLDYRMRGVGGYDSWGAMPDPQYRIPANAEYSWGFRLIPY
jgi:beta-galactosidase